MMLNRAQMMHGVTVEAGMEVNFLMPFDVSAGRLRPQYSLWPV